MEITNIEALIAQGKILKPTDLDPANDYLIVGKWQKGSRKNGGDITTTSRVINFSRFPDESETIISLSYYVQVAAGDKVQIMWSVSDKFIEITPIGGNSAQPNPDAYPAGDCVTLNINKIS